MTKKVVIRMIIMLVLVAVVLGGVVAFNMAMKAGMKSFMASMGMPTETVTATKVTYQEWQPSLTAVGTLRAVRGVDVAMEGPGVVSEVLFRAGAEVKTGDVLLRMRADDIAAQLQQLEASAQLAEVNFKRSTELLAAKAISQAQNEVDAANVKTTRAAVAQQQATMAKKTLRAPFDGRLGVSKVAPGQFLNAGEMVVTLQQLDPIYVDFNVPQRQMGQMAVGRPVTLTLDAFPGRTFRGSISAINPRVDAATRNVQVQATLSNPGRVLTPGMFTSVTVDVGAKQRYLTLPQTAVTYNPFGETIFVVKRDGDMSGDAAKAGDASKSGEAAKDGAKQDAAKKDAGKAGKQGQAGPPPEGTAQQVFVTTGPTRGDQVAIIKGLEEGTEVVTSGQNKLKNGTPLHINNNIVPANDANPRPQE